MATRERHQGRSPSRWRASSAPQVPYAPSRPRRARNPLPTWFQRDLAPLESVGRMAAPARGRGRDGHAQPGHGRAGPDQRDELLDPAGAGECGSERSVRPRTCRHARPSTGQADEADEVDAGRGSTSCARSPKKTDHFAAAEWITVRPPPKVGDPAVPDQPGGGSGVHGTGVAAGVTRRGRAERNVLHHGGEAVSRGGRK